MKLNLLLADIRMSIFCKIKAVKRLCGGVPEWYAAQANEKANAEIAEKWHPV